MPRDNMKRIFKMGLLLLLLSFSLTGCAVLDVLRGDREMIPYNNGVPDATGTIRYQWLNLQTVAVM